MKHLIKQFAILFLIYSTITSYSIKAMDRLNNQITVVNEINEPKGLLQLAYAEYELSPNPKKLLRVGMNTIMNAPTEFKCRIANNHVDGHSSLRIVDPRARQKKIKLKMFHNDTLTIHAKNDENVIVIKQNGDIVHYFRYS